MSEDSGFQIGQNAPEFYEAHVSRLMAPFVEALVAAAIAPGQSVLDVACGTGFATRAAAAVAGRDARVEGSDLNPAMVAQAQAVPDTSGGQLRWTQASALDLPYEDNSFDSVICQQGLQFFPDPAAGVREMARVAREGGRLGVTVWSAAEQSPFLHREMQMLARYGGEALADYSASEQQLRAWFVNAGVGDVCIELLAIDVDLPPVSTFVPEHLKALPWSTTFFRLPPERQLEALAELEADLDVYRTDAGIRVPFSSYLVTAIIGKSATRMGSRGSTRE
jgi:SAM-dependent methyltransferase